MSTVKDLVMRKDVKLGLLLSFVVVVVAGVYYLSTDKTEEPLSLADAGAPGKGPVDDAARKKSLATSETAKTKAGPSADRTATARQPQQPTADRSARTTPGAPGVQRPTPTTPRPTTPSDRPPTATAEPKPAGEAAPSVTRDNPASPARETPAHLTPGIDQLVKDTAEGLFQFDKTTPAPVELPAGPTATTVKPTEQPAVTTPPAQGEKKPGSVAPGSAKSVAPTGRPPTEKAVPEPAKATRTHTVQKGDSFALLAEVYYGSQRHTPFLIEANPEHSDPSRLRAGVILRIPPLPGQPDESLTRSDRTATVRERPAPEGREGRTYVVREGDTFYRIAARELGRGSRWLEVFELNKDVVNGKPERLHVGQVLELPLEKPATSEKGTSEKTTPEKKK
ncbi:MAG: LysM peptidoglycan-binding domain-containing protein [Planctomycetota bacterium]